jgi:transposase
MLYRQGLSISLIADAFNLSRSGVRLVIAKCAPPEDPAEADAQGQAPPVLTRARATARAPKHRRLSRRNLVLRLLHRQGVSAGYLAEAFNMSLSRIREILTESSSAAGPESP